MMLHVREWVIDHGTEILDKLVEKDRYQIFWEPVDPNIVVGYLEVIKNPMDLATCRNKLESGEYANLDAMRRDVDLIWSNCCTFNPRDTVFFKEAVKLREFANKRFRVAAEAFKLMEEKRARMGRPASTGTFHGVPTVQETDSGASKGDGQYRVRLVADTESGTGSSFSDLGKTQPALAKREGVMDKQGLIKRGPGRPKGSGKRQLEARMASEKNGRDNKWEGAPAKATPGPTKAIRERDMSVASGAGSFATKDESSDESSASQPSASFKDALPYPRPPSPPAKHFPNAVTKPRSEYRDVKWLILGSKPKPNPVRPMAGQTSIRAKDYAASLRYFVSTCDSNMPRDIVNELLLPETMAAKDEEARMLAYQQAKKERENCPEPTTEAPVSKRSKPEPPSNRSSVVPPVIRPFSSWVTDDILEELESLDPREIDTTAPFGIRLEDLGTLTSLVGPGRELKALRELVENARRAVNTKSTKQAAPERSRSPEASSVKAPRSRLKPVASRSGNAPQKSPTLKGPVSSAPLPRSDAIGEAAPKQPCRNCGQPLPTAGIADGLFASLCEECANYFIQNKRMRPNDGWKNEAGSYRTAQPRTQLPEPADLGPSVFESQSIVRPDVNPPAFAQGPLFEQERTPPVMEYAREEPPNLFPQAEHQDQQQGAVWPPTNSKDSLYDQASPF